MSKKALIVVDLQNDFMPGGALAVESGDVVLPVINALLKRPFDRVVASLDWHPADHGSFASRHGKEPGEEVQLGGVRQVLWPDHCVENTPGADFAPGWDAYKVQKVFHKGVDRDIDSYSVFFDNGHRKSTGLAEYLKKEQIDTLFLVGLATDYCAKYSALDALKLGFQVYVIEDACRGVNLHPGDDAKALQEVRTAGAHVVKSTSLPE